MDVIQIALTASIGSLCSAVVGAIVATSITYVKESKKGHDDMADAVRELNKLNAIGQARTAYRFALQDGYITVSDLAYIKSLVECGHKFGANGELTEIEELADKLPKRV